MKEAQNKSQLESRKSQVKLEVLNFNGVAKKVAYLNFKLLILIVSNLRLATCDFQLPTTVVNENELKLIIYNVETEAIEQWTN